MPLAAPRLCSDATLQLHETGYVVLSGRLSQGWIELALTVCGTYQKDEQEIFNANDPADPTDRRNDGLRSQGRIPEGDALNELRRGLRMALHGWITPDHTMEECSVLKSEPGCTQQFCHTDHAVAAVQGVPHHRCPLLALIALEPGTRLIVWPFQAGGPVKLVLKVGDVLLFRADLRHAGAAYDRRNVRLHVYIDHPGVPRPPDTTHPC